jgi:hypothetical protein
MGRAPAPGSVTHSRKGEVHLAQRALKRIAGPWKLWAMGVGAVIPGAFSGWNSVDPASHRAAAIGAAAWFLVGIVCFAVHSRHRLVLSPEEQFALGAGARAPPEADEDAVPA